MKIPKEKVTFTGKSLFRLRENAAKLGYDSLADYVDYLQDFHDLLYLEDLITQYKIKIREGLNLKQIVQTDVLYSFLESITSRLKR